MNVVELGVKGLPDADDGGYWLTNRARLIERLPDVFSTIWMFDRLMFDDEPGAEAWTAVTWMAATFPNKRVGNMVMSQGYRNPAVMGLAAATLQRLSGGRVVLGLGAGWIQRDYRAFNIPFVGPGDRVAQLAEAIELIKTLWSSQPATFEGKWYSIHDAYCVPPQPRVPIMVGTNGPRALKVVARLADWWVWDGPLDIGYRKPLDHLRAECAAIGRPFDEITKVAELSVWLTDDESRFERTYEHEAYPGQLFGLSGPTADVVIRDIEDLVDVGVAHIAINFEDMSTFDRFLTEVVPHVRLQPR